jgi:hypothetical protein
MGGQRLYTTPSAGGYKDPPYRDDTASLSSAVQLSDIEYPEEVTPLSEGFPEDELPAYTDIPNLPQSSNNEAPIS